MPSRTYDGPDLDATGQHITEAPYWQREGETVDVVDDTPRGEERTENVPVPDGGDERPDREGQTTLDDWGGASA